MSPPAVQNSSKTTGGGGGGQNSKLSHGQQGHLYTMHDHDGYPCTQAAILAGLIMDKQVSPSSRPDDYSMASQVGSGTDPAEGAALAGAILDRLAGSARLTFATSHHAELKTVPVRCHLVSCIWSAQTSTLFACCTPSGQACWQA